MPEGPHRHEAPGSGRVLAMSTIAFTMMFAVWLMFGILGKPIQAEFGLTDVELSWISAVAVLNGSMWRLPAGMLADRIGGKKVMLFLLVSGAVASFAVSFANSYPMLLVAAAVVGVGSATFHPEASRIARLASGGRFGTAQSTFQVGGNTGTAIGPLLTAAIVIPYGQSAVAWFMLVALAGGLLAVGRLSRVLGAVRRVGLALRRALCLAL